MNRARSVQIVSMIIKVATFLCKTKYHGNMAYTKTCDSVSSENTVTTRSMSRQTKHCSSDTKGSASRQTSLTTDRNVISALEYSSFLPF